VARIPDGRGRDGALTVLLFALLDALPFGIGAGVAGVLAAAGSGIVSPLLLGPIAGLAVYAGAIGVSLAVYDGDKPFPLVRATFPELLWP